MPNLFIAMRRLRWPEHQGVLFWMFQSFELNVGIQLWSVELRRPQPLNGVYLSNGGFSKNRIIVEGNEVFHIIHQ